MSLLSTELTLRCGSSCEICGAKSSLTPYVVLPKTGLNTEDLVALCGTCLDQVQMPENADVSHWRCLNESMWSTIPAVQVLSYRMLNNLSDQPWAQDLLGMMYLDEETQEWADALSDATVHKDSNGQILQAGDTVILIKDLDVKGANFTAKRGTAVRKISLVHDNPEQIEGKVNDQHIVILTKFVRKSV
jgi:protein PhnA